MRRRDTYVALDIGTEQGTFFDVTLTPATYAEFVKKEISPGCFAPRAITRDPIWQILIPDDRMWTAFAYPMSEVVAASKTCGQDLVGCYFEGKAAVVSHPKKSFITKGVTCSIKFAPFTTPCAPVCTNFTCCNCGEIRALTTYTRLTKDDPTWFVTGTEPIGPIVSTDNLYSYAAVGPHSRFKPLAPVTSDTPDLEGPPIPVPIPGSAALLYPVKPLSDTWKAIQEYATAGQPRGLHFFLTQVFRVSNPDTEDLFYATRKTYERQLLRCGPKELVTWHGTSATPGYMVAGHPTGLNPSFASPKHQLAHGVGIYTTRHLAYTHTGRYSHLVKPDSFPAPSLVIPHEPSMPPLGFQAPPSARPGPGEDTTLLPTVDPDANLIFELLLVHVLAGNSLEMDSQSSSNAQDVFKPKPGQPGYNSMTVAQGDGSVNQINPDRCGVTVAYIVRGTFGVTNAPAKLPETRKK